MGKYNKYSKILIGLIVVAFVIIVGISIVTINTTPTIETKQPSGYEETLTVYADEDYAPYSFIDKAGNPQGYDIELIYMLAEEMKMNVDLRLIPWNVELEEMDLSQADIVLGLEYSDAHGNMFDLSNPVQVSEYVAFGKNNLEMVDQLQINRIGILEGSMAYSLIIEPHRLQKHIKIYSTYEAGFQAILDNKIDYLIGRYSVGKRVLSQQGIDDIKPQGQTLASHTYCFGVQKGNTDLLNRVNNAIYTQYESNEINRIANKWLGHFVNVTSLSEFYVMYQGPIYIFVGGLLGIAILLIVSIEKEKIKLKHEKEMRNELKKQLETDDLTGGISLYKFKALVQDRLAQTQLENKSWTMINIDIDNFKYINESYGYEIGNQVIRSVYNYLIDVCNTDDLVTRSNNDNFLVLKKDGESDLMAEYRKKKRFSIGDLLGQDIIIQFSIGIYGIDDITEKIEHMIDYANGARLKEKNIYGNTICYFTDEMKKDRDQKNIIVSTMETALINQEYYMLYQPKYDVKTGYCVGAEALVRWKTKAGETIYPNDFIPLFEDNGFIVRLDYYIMEAVCCYIANEKLTLPTISVNLSGKTIAKQSVVEDYCAILKKYELEPHQIEIEITESAMVNQYDKIKQQIDDFRKAGFAIAVDDFGVGESSLTRIQKINIDTVKLDKGFLDDVFKEAKSRQIIQGILATARILKTTTVAEGIETKEQLELLREIGCDIGQGYYFAKGMEQDEFTKLIEKNEIRL